MKIHFSLCHACWLFGLLDVSSSSITIETFLNSVWKTLFFKGRGRKKSSAVGWLTQCVWNERDACVRVENSQKSWIRALVQIWKDTDTDTHVRDSHPSPPFAPHPRNTVAYTGLDCVDPSFLQGQWAMRVSARVKRALNPLPPRRNI